MRGAMEVGGKLAYSYGGVEPRKFGLGLVAGLLLVTCAYFSTVKLDAVHIVMSKQPFQPQALSSRAKNVAGIGSPANAGDRSKQTLDLDSDLQDQGAWSSHEGSKAEVLEKDGEDGNGISSFGQGPVSSLEETHKDETSARNNGDAAGVAVVSAASPDPAEEGRKDDEVPEKDDDPSAVAAAIPPLSSDSSDSTQESSGVLEDQELQVQNAIAAAANPPKESNSVSNNDTGSFSETSSDPAEIPVPAPSPEIEPPSSANEISAANPPKESYSVSSNDNSITPEIPSDDTDEITAPAPSPEIEPPSSANEISATSSEVKDPTFQLTKPIPKIKQTDWKAPVREWQPLCDVTSNHRIDWCELDGDVRVVGSNASVTLVAPPGADTHTFHEESWSIKPYPRKADPNAMHSVGALTVRSVSMATDAPRPPACTDWHDVPALVFSVRGYTGNYFHAYTDVVLPLFLTARQYAGEVVLLVTGFQAWLVGKYEPVFRSLSKYAPVDLDADPRVRCFRHVQVGLTSHDDFSIDPRRAPNGSSMLDFTRFMRATYGLPRDVAVASASASASRGRWRPRLLVIARARTRRFLNTEEIVRGARRVGFEVVVSEGTHEVAPFAELVNTCDAVVGVHGAGLTNMVFLPRGGVVVQVLPLGPLEFVASYFRGPAGDMGLTYLEYRISPEESTLVDQYPRDHPVLTDPMSLSSKAKDWVSFMGVYLFKQDVRLDMKRFRPVLKKAIARLRANNKPQN